MNCSDRKSLLTGINSLKICHSVTRLQESS